MKFSSFLDKEFVTDQYVFERRRGWPWQANPFEISLLRGEQVQKRIDPLMRPIEGI